MPRFNPEFWEIPTQSTYLEGVSNERALWYETDEDRERRHAMQEFFQSVMPSVKEMIDTQLTQRQREVMGLYFFKHKTQEDIAAILNLSQSTVSRHLFGTVRNGKKIGGAIPKLKKAIDRCPGAPVDYALNRLQQRFAETAQAM